MAGISKCRQDPSRVDGNGRAYAGSQRQIQTYVNWHASEFSSKVIASLPSPVPQGCSIGWVSPLAADKFSEYRDADFLRAVGLQQHIGNLKQFWPSNGPCWDALGILRTEVVTHDTKVVLVEAKSYPAEALSSYCKATGPNRVRIQKALQLTKEWLGVEDSPEAQAWTWKVYQYANRLAHLFFLREIAKVPAWLVNVYFVGDPHRPTTEDEWRGTLMDLKSQLGLSGALPYCSDLLLPAVQES